MSDMRIWWNLVLSAVYAFTTVAILSLAVSALKWLIESNNEEFVLAFVVFVLFFVFYYNQLSEKK